MKPLHLRDDETQAWKIGTNVIERAIPQDIVCEVKMLLGEHTPPIKIVMKEESKYHPGDKVAAKETWENVNKPGITPEYVYKSDYDDAELSECKNDGGTWHSPVTMPFQAVRYHAIITSVEAVEHDGKWYWKITMEATS